MNTRLGISLSILCFVVVLLPAAQSSAQMPPAIAVPGDSIIATFHAEGAQIYECKPDPKNKLFWMLREPVAVLISGDKTVGFHNAGPNWQHIDGSAVQARMVSAVPGATFSDVPWLKLEATGHRGDGILSHVAAIQRINTKGGAMQGPCETAGLYRSVPYSADYIFLRKRG